jgi:hypothetical protein
MLPKWAYLFVLKHPRRDFHLLAEADHTDNWIFICELTPPNGIQLIQKICDPGFTL